MTFITIFRDLYFGVIFSDKWKIPKFMTLVFDRRLENTQTI